MFANNEVNRDYGVVGFDLHKSYLKKLKKEAAKASGVSAKTRARVASVGLIDAALFRSSSRRRRSETRGRATASPPTTTTIPIAASARASTRPTTKVRRAITTRDERGFRRLAEEREPTGAG